jgi:hypothetical protein
MLYTMPATLAVKQKRKVVGIAGDFPASTWKVSAELAASLQITALSRSTTLTCALHSAPLRKDLSLCVDEVLAVHSAKGREALALCLHQAADEPENHCFSNPLRCLCAALFRQVGGGEIDRDVLSQELWSRLW